MVVQSLGERRMRVGFNPSERHIVTSLKTLTASLIDMVNSLPDEGDGEVKRLKAMAMTDFEMAGMLAVKAATYDV